MRLYVLSQMPRIECTISCRRMGYYCLGAPIVWRCESTDMKPTIASELFIVWCPRYEIGTGLVKSMA
jgi:hypothetical protein